MYCYSDIRHVHLEISSRCNAACPLCPRNFYGYPYNDGYVEHDMTLDEAKKIFSPDFLKQLNEIYINGNFGDIVMNDQAIEIIEYFRDNNPDIDILISTNGGARPREFWQELARLRTRVFFCIDGLEDTHHLYRQNTVFEVVIKNARAFIDAGGWAGWKMIKFDHNVHQAAEAEQRSKDIGFTSFLVVDHGRNVGPVFNHKKQLVHVLGKPHDTDFERLFESRTKDQVLLEHAISDEEIFPVISCHIKEQKSVYISSIGDVYPCCFLGFSPKTYGNGNWHSVANRQFDHMIEKNNALQYPLEQCIAWFTGIENTWDIPTFEQGRLLLCNRVCGKPNK